MKKTHAAVTEGGTAISRYQDVVVGDRSLYRLISFKFCLFLSPMPGALGIFMHKLFLPRPSDLICSVAALLSRLRKHEKVPQSSERVNDQLKLLGQRSPQPWQLGPKVYWCMRTASTRDQLRAASFFPSI